MTTFEVYVAICVTPIGILGWGFIGSCLIDAYEKHKRKQEVRRWRLDNQ